ncbi:MAG: acyl-ACP desaturase [bacterium]|nr:acyl-ACP desaturase [bacterium]
MKEIETRLHSGVISWETLTRRRGIKEVWTPSSIVTHRDHTQIAREMRLLSREVQIVLIGDTLTEEALPTYTNFLASTQGMPDDYESDLQKWIREWSAEEERHGTLLDRILYMSDAIDMEAYERSKHMLINNGMDIGTKNDPYRVFYYTSFQELATQVSHANVAKCAKDEGAPLISKSCKVIAGDEGMHAKMYSSFVKAALDIDPDGMTTTISEMMRQRVQMPAYLMQEVRADTSQILEPGPLFEAFSDCAQHAGVYTSKDYARISGKLLQEWDLAKKDNDGNWQVSETRGLSELSLENVAVCVKIQRVIERLADKTKTPDMPDHKFSWILS